MQLTCTAWVDYLDIRSGGWEKRIQEESGLLDRSGNSGYPRLGNTGAEILQNAGEQSSSTTENLL
jgi:hypothetical protein